MPSPAAEPVDSEPVDSGSVAPATGRVAAGIRTGGILAGGIRDLAAGAAIAALFALAVVVGRLATDRGVALFAPTPPLFAPWDPRVGPGSAVAVAVAALVVTAGPRWAHRGRFPVAVLGGALLAAVWGVGLALVDGQDGLTAPLASPTEYLQDVPRVGSGWTGALQTLRTFTDDIPGSSPTPWRTHVAGHPPGLLFVFVALDRLGLGGPQWAAALCVVSTASVVAAVAVTIRHLAADPVAGQTLARRVLPFTVLAPGAVWAVVSADAVVAAVGAWGLALLAVATGSRHGPRWAAAAGVVLGGACLLSYGAVLLGVPALAILAIRRRWTLLLPAAAAAATVLLLVAAAGFAWWEGIEVLRGRYAEGLGGTRPYAYWAWANVAVLAVSAGPAAAAGLRRLLDRGGDGPAPQTRRTLLALTGGALLACAIASVSGLSKAETERIWLPWTLWLPAAAAVLPGARGWLAVQAVVALLTQHLLRSPW